MAYVFEEDKKKTKLKEALLDMVYPVGSIYMSVENVNPQTLFGGTWIAWGAGKTIVGVNADETEFNTVEKTGGAKTVTLTESQMPKHKHEYTHANGLNKEFVLVGSGSAKSVIGDVDLTFPSSKYYVTETGSGNAHNNLQPYITCYMWKRTA